MTRRRLAALVTVCVLALVACSSGSAQGPVSDPPPGPGLSASLTQYRIDEAQRRVQVKLRQDPDAGPVVVRELSVRMPGFAEGEVRELDSSSRPGAVVDLPVVYGEASCPGAATDLAASAPSGVVTARLRLEGHDDLVELVLDDPFGLPSRLWRQECAVRAALAAVPIELGPDWRRRSGDGTAGSGSLVGDGVLVLGPVAPGRFVDVVELVGTTLFGFEVTGGGPLPSLQPGGRVQLPVTVTPQRCDPHAVGESKRGYAFGVRMAVDGAEPVLVTASPWETVRAAMEEVLLERCGLG